MGSVKGFHSSSMRKSSAPGEKGFKKGPCKNFYMEPNFRALGCFGASRASGWVSWFQRPCCRCCSGFVPQADPDIFMHPYPNLPLGLSSLSHRPPRLVGTGERNSVPTLVGTSMSATCLWPASLALRCLMTAGDRGSVT